MDQIQKALCNLISARPSCISERHELKNFLYERTPLSKLQQNLVLYAYDENVVERLNTSEDVAFSALCLIRDLQENCGLHSNFAFWAVEAWCHILGHRDVALVLEGVRPALLNTGGVNVPPVQEYKIRAGVHRVGTDFPAGEISVEIIGETDETIYYGTSINPNRMSANNKFGRKIYLRLSDGQYLKLEAFRDASLLFKVRVIV